MKAKALQNLRAAGLLFDRGLFDAAAGRYHYSLFQACVHALERRGATPGESRPGALRWGHPMVQGRAGEIRGRPEDERFFERVRDLRERADYNPEPVGRWDVESCRREVERFVLEATE